MSAKPKVLVVTGNERELSEMALALQSDFEVLTARDRQSAEALFKSTRPAMMLVDVDYPPAGSYASESLDLINDMVTLDRLAKVILLVSKGEGCGLIGAPGAMRGYEVMPKPARIEELKQLLRSRLQVLQPSVDRGGKPEEGEQAGFEGMLGSSPVMREVFRSIQKVAATDAPVLLCGEGGVGKSMAALAIHRLSARKGGPFVRINCGTIGREFSDADTLDRETSASGASLSGIAGRFQEAIGGTLFLSDIDELPVRLQGEIVELLCEHGVERLDSGWPQKALFRVISSSSTDLMGAVAERKFRADLYYLLTVVVIRIPPLRKRDNDVIELAKLFLDRLSRHYDKPGLVFGGDAIEAINRYSWPGNLRELEARIRRAVVMCESSVVRAADLELPATESGYLARTLKDARRALEREMILQTLEKHGGNISAAASDLQVSRATFYNIMARLGIERKRVVKSTNEEQGLKQA